jgi:hypothetical protein
MHQHCHRCGGELASSDDITPFCPHCGAPQLYLQEYDRTPQNPDPSAPDPNDSTGTAPPPHPQQVDWKTAIRCAALVAGAAAILTLVAIRVPVLSPLRTLTILSASVLTLSLYQHRRPTARINAAIGARIGLVVGLSLILSLAITMAIVGLVSRYGLHSMGTFDADLTQQMRTQIEHASAANPASPELLHYFYTPEFRAGMMLTGVAMVGAVLMLLSTVGGALGGFVRTRRSPAV